MKNWLKLLLISALVIQCKKGKFEEVRYQPIVYNKMKVQVPIKETTTIKLPEKKTIYAIFQTSAGNMIVELFPEEAPKTVQNFIDLAQGNIETTNSSGEKQKKPFYDGLTFHRVIENFMIQGGDPLGNGTGGPGYKFEDEINGKAIGLDKIIAGESQYYNGQLQKLVVTEMGIKNREEFLKKQEEFEKNYESAKKMTALEVLYRLGYRYNEVLNSKKAIKGSLAMANAGPNTNGSQFFINQVDTPHLDGLHTVFGQLVEGMNVLEAIVKAGNSNTKIKKLTIIDLRE